MNYLFFFICRIKRVFRCLYFESRFQTVHINVQRVQIKLSNCLIYQKCIHCGSLEMQNLVFSLLFYFGLRFQIGQHLGAKGQN